MPESNRSVCFTAVATVVLVLLLSGESRTDDAAPSATPIGAQEKSPQVRVEEPERIRGKVVFFHQELAELTGIQPNRDALDRVLAVKTDDGRLLPILEDVRGGAFRKDKRLRDMKVELLVRRPAKTPMLQVLRVYEITKQGKSEIVYWCDICAITMYELRECACCQGPIELKRRALGNDEIPDAYRPRK